MTDGRTGNGAYRASPGSAACTAVVGMQWGDEGKGKVVDLLAGEHDATVRYNGGANAGHSVVVGGERFALHLVPSGILHPGCRAIIGNGVAVDPFKLSEELDGLGARGVDTSRLVLSSRAHVVTPYHKVIDEYREDRLAGDGGRAIGTTKRGIGPCYSDKAQRSSAIRAGDLVNRDRLVGKLELARRFDAALADAEPVEAVASKLHEVGQRLEAHIEDTTYLIHGMLGEGKSVLFEGGNATLLDVDHGTYPYVTSSVCSVLGIPAGTGVPGAMLTRVVGVVKAYSTRVGAGPMPTELHDQTGELIRKRGREYGTTTGRPRRCGWLDLVALRYSAMINGVTELAVMLLDVLETVEPLRVCVAYEIDGERTDRFMPDAAELERAVPVYETLEPLGDGVAEARTLEELPKAARAYLDRICEVAQAPLGLVSVGPDRSQTLRLTERTHV